MYVDDNGIVRFENLDKLAPLQTSLNTALESVSTALDSTSRIFVVANAAERDQLAIDRPPSPAHPLYAHRADTGNLERNTGSGWVIYPPQRAAHMRSLDAVRAIPDSTYDWIGTMSPVAVSGLTAEPPQFSYVTTDGATFGQGLQANVDGIFRLSADVSFQGRAGGGRYVRMVVDGTTLDLATNMNPGSGIARVQLQVTARLTVGERLGAQIYQNTGTPLELVASNNRTNLLMEYLG